MIRGVVASCHSASRCSPLEVRRTGFSAAVGLWWIRQARLPDPSYPSPALG